MTLHIPFWLIITLWILIPPIISLIMLGKPRHPYDIISPLTAIGITVGAWLSLLMFFVGRWTL